MLGEDKPAPPRGEVLDNIEKFLRNLPTPTLPSIPWRTLPHDPRRLLDEKLRAQALSLLQSGYRALFHDVYDFKTKSYKPGLGQLGPDVFAAYKGFFAGFQLMQQQPLGSVGEIWAQRLHADRKNYDKLRKRVSTALTKAGMGKTSSQPGALLFPVPGEGETWRDYVDTRTEAPRQRFSAGLLVLGGLALYFWARR